MTSSGEKLTAEQQDDAYMAVLPAVEARLLEEYDRRLLFHGPAHAEYVRDDSLQKRSTLVAAGVENVPGIFVTAAAAIGHDAGTCEFWRSPERDQNIEYPEHFAIKKTARVLTDHKVDRDTVAEILSYQWPTKVGVKADTIGSYTLCAADLSRTSEDYDTVFAADKDHLRLEECFLKDNLRSKQDYDDFSMWLLSTYHVVNLHPGNLPVSITSLFEFQNRARRANLAHLAELRAAANGESVISYATRIGDTALRVVTNNL